MSPPKGNIFNKYFLSFQHGHGSVNIIQEFWENVTRMLTREFGEAAECKSRLSGIVFCCWKHCSQIDSTQPEMPICVCPLRTHLRELAT